MKKTPVINRRAFLVATSAAASGLSLGFHVPFGTDPAAAQKGTTKAGSEVNAWVFKIGRAHV